MDLSSSGGEIHNDLNLPFGYRFDPTDVELVKFYMIPKLKGEKLPSEYIMDLDDDVCKYDPPHLLSMYNLKNTRENEVFFFTRDSREDESRTRTNPNGCWKVHQENMAIVDYRAGEGAIGFKTKLFFHDLNGNLTNWKMTEFRCTIPTATPNVERYKVCKIKLRRTKEKCLVGGISQDEK